MDKEEEKRCNDLVATCRKIKADYDSGKISKEQICDNFPVGSQEVGVLQCVFEPDDKNFEIWFHIEKEHNIKIAEQTRQNFLSEIFPNEIARHAFLKMTCMLIHGCTSNVNQVNKDFPKEIFKIWSSMFIDIPDFKNVMIEVSDWFADLSTRNNCYNLEIDKEIKRMAEELK